MVMLNMRLSYRAKIATIVMALCLVPLHKTFSCPCDDDKEEEQTSETQTQTQVPQVNGQR